ncbi:MAG: hypothetical protein K8T89_15575, partial [Planctomycetes bacterium]|nr:hypothetical protein [Planctomycetota bacterium]
NEDECLTALELVPNLLTRGINPAIPLYSPNSTANRAGAALQIYRLNAIPDAVMEQMLIRYDEDKNLRLNKVESGLDEAAFVKLDKNGDGELSISELMAWRDLPPDLAVEIIVGAVQGESVIKLLPGADGKPSPFAKHVTITPDGKATLQLGSQQMELFSPNSSTNFVPINRGYDLFFDQIDVKKQGYLTEQDLAGTQFQYMRVIFDIVDRNGDGRMAKKEYVDYVELQQSFTGVALAISHFTQTPSLFALLDANGDGRLSVREMRTAWERLKTLEPGGQFISKSALKPQAWLRFTMSRQMNQGLVGTNYNPMVQPPTKGPLWFRKMDRNSDGDVSRAEFPGRTEDFDKLDLDHDGLIGLDEAEAAEKVFRAVKP